MIQIFDLSHPAQPVHAGVRASVGRKTRIGLSP
jgi:hypothetical protein